MTPAHSLIGVQPDESVAEALRKLAENDVDQLPVLKDGQPPGTDPGQARLPLTRLRPLATPSCSSLPEQLY
jgi:CBS domain-containing protein